MDARHDWWGTTDVSKIEAGIFDFFDNSFKGIVFIDPIALGNANTGDFDQSGVLDRSDYDAWKAKVGTSVNALSGADGNGNGIVDAADYVLWRKAFSLQRPSVSTFVSVPEPAAWVLAIGAATSLLARFGHCRSYQT